MSLRYVAFGVGPTRYCLPISEVRQIVRHEGVTEVPRAPPFVEGVMNLRGDVIPVIGMRLRLGIAGEGNPRKSRVIIVDVGGRLYGLHVDDVREIVEVEERCVETENLDVINTDAVFVRAIARVGDQLLVVLNLAKLLAGSAARL
jgi:purine-binding chemotaxis protein CheW